MGVPALPIVTELPASYREFMCTQESPPTTLVEVFERVKGKFDGERLTEAVLASIRHEVVVGLRDVAMNRGVHFDAAAVSVSSRYERVIIRMSREQTERFIERMMPEEVAELGRIAKEA